jgi:hypothetical protein
VNGEDFAQDQMCWEKSDEPQHAKPQDDIKVLVDPVLRLPVVETIDIIDVDRNVRIHQMRPGFLCKYLSSLVV